MDVDDFLLDEELKELCRDARQDILLFWVASASIEESDLLRVDVLDVRHEDIRGDVAVLQTVSATDIGETSEGEEADEGGEATTGRIKGVCFGDGSSALSLI